VNVHALVHIEEESNPFSDSKIMKCYSFELANSIQISFVLCRFKSSISIYQTIRLLFIILPHLSTSHLIL